MIMFHTKYRTVEEFLHFITFDHSPSYENTTESKQLRKTFLRKLELII